MTSRRMVITKDEGRWAVLGYCNTGIYTANKGTRNILEIIMLLLEY